MTQVNIQRMCVTISGILVICLALLAGLDTVLYGGQLKLGTWGYDQYMSVPTSICFILIGSALILIARRSE